MDFRPKLPTLPTDVLAMIQPALDAVSKEARHGASLVTLRRLDRSLKVALRINGATYERGARGLIQDAAGDMLAEVRDYGHAVTMVEGVQTGDDRQHLRIDDDTADDNDGCDCESCNR